MSQTKEEMMVRVIQSGDVAVDAGGRFWRHYDRRHSKRIHLEQPRRIDHPDEAGYHRVGFSYEGRNYSTFAHRVVWVLHNGPIPDGVEVNHKDLDKSNNSIGNLELMTHVDNMRHARRMGAWTSPHEDSEVTGLSRAELKEIRRAWETGVTVEHLANVFDVSLAIIRQAVGEKEKRSA